jgi:hypothetical protein
MGTLTVLSMLEAALKNGGYDGLYRESCGCEIGDLVPCNCDPSDCAAGYRQPDTDPDELVIGPERCTAPDTQISLFDTTEEMQP